MKKLFHFELSDLELKHSLTLLVAILIVDVVLLPQLTMRSCGMTMPKKTSRQKSRKRCMVLKSQDIEKANHCLLKQ